jgi:hypothetical protein
MSELWLDEDRESGDALLAVAARKPGEDRTWAAPQAILSKQRAFVVVAVQAEPIYDAGPRLQLLVGLFPDVEILCRLLLDPWPLRLFIPARQSFSIVVMYHDAPMTVRFWWERPR